MLLLGNIPWTVCSSGLLLRYRFRVRLLSHKGVSGEARNVQALYIIGLSASIKIVSELGRYEIELHDEGLAGFEKVAGLVVESDIEVLERFLFSVMMMDRRLKG